MLSSYSRILMVSRAHVLSASRPDFRDIITRQASGVPGIETIELWEPGQIKKKVIRHTTIKGTLNRVNQC